MIVIFPLVKFTAQITEELNVKLQLLLEVPYKYQVNNNNIYI